MIPASGTCRRTCDPFAPRSRRVCWSAVTRSQATRVSITEIGSALALDLKLAPYTVNDREVWSRLVEIGVTGITTDFPQEGA